MVRYIVKRLLQFIPSFILITFLGFVLNDYAPVDPAERLAARSLDGGKPITGNQRDIALKQWRHKLGLDLPMFYISVKSLAEPDTLERIADRGEREMLAKLTEQYGDWERISLYYYCLKKVEIFVNIQKAYLEQQCSNQSSQTNGDSLFVTDYKHKSFFGFAKTDCSPERFNKINLAIEKINALKICIDDSSLEANLLYLRQAFPEEYSIRRAGENYIAVREESNSISRYIPSISFHADNRYHRWLFGDGENSKGVLRGDFGFSYATGEPVGDILASHIWYTLLFSLGGIFLAYLISIPLGVYAAVKKNSWFDRSSSVVLFLLYSMPSFWLATLLLMAFANPDVLYWFEASGVKPAQGFREGASVFEKLRIALPYLALPMICYTYSSLAFLSRTLRVSVLETIKQDYITTARAKGLPENKVVWRHAFRNALLPLITVLANVFPYAIGGSVILETVFTIPGLGFETFRAITSQDYPIIMAMLTLTSVLTMLGLLVQDILYALADPRISFNNTKR